MNAAVLFIDLQNDFLHPEGAYGRAGLKLPAVDSLLNNAKALADKARGLGMPVISSQFTLVPTLQGEPLIDPHLKKLRPFLGKGDFEPGKFGHQPLEMLGQMDYEVEKVAYSAFFQTRLEFILRKLGIDTLFVAGIVTNGGVASTARDAHTRGFSTYVVKDACAAFKSETQDIAIAGIGALLSTPTVEEASRILSEG